jgi:hypothetical protein
MPRPHADENAQDLLSDSLALAPTQLASQIADENSLDGRTMGTLGFNGALLAADLVAGGLLGPYWWTPLIAIVLATLCCLRPALAIGLNFARPTDIGPVADRFYRTYARGPSKVGREQMLDDLSKAVANNARRFTAKRRALQAALIVLALGLGAAALLIVLS